ncbi:hypothetical protein GGF46_001497 [Coemansia sp. RSA 552]|nr:hypothetical protein GGF46_001497 [Coemansia sp. RSA 552]
MDAPGPCRQLAWVANVACPDAAVDATAALAPVDATATVPAQPLWPGGRLRLLAQLQLGSVPPVLFSATAFNLFINTDGCDHSRRYINGLVHMLVSSRQAAVLARIEGVEQMPPEVSDPFADTLSSDNTEQPPLPASPFVLIYAEPVPSPRLILHMLDTSQGRLELLAMAAREQAARTEDSAGAVADPPKGALRDEHAFIRRLAEQCSAAQKERIQRSMSAGSMVLGSGSSQRRSSSSTRARNNKRMTLRDIEHFAAGSGSGPARQQQQPPPQQQATDEPSEETELANKKLAKQLIIASLKERGISRDHADFAALWSQIYRSLKFALRSKLPRLVYSARDLRAEVEKHACFYCSA